MANNVLQFPGTAGNSYDLYVSSGATLWNGTAFVTPTAGNWTTCALAMTDANSVGIFAYTMPASIAAGPSYGFTVRQRAGASAAPTDPVVGSIAYSWDGTDLGAVTVGALPATAPAGYGPGGTGSVVVSADYPTAGNLAFKTSGGEGIGGAQVRAYLASEYASDPNAATVRGQTITLSDGSWSNNMLLDPGSYTVVFQAAGYQTTEVSLTVS